jgi:hypothetical protein
MNARDNRSTWTPERIATLRAGVAAGMTYSDIAKAMGMTKNQCSGKADRLGLRPEPREAPRTLGDRMNEIHARLDRVLAETRDIPRLPSR